MGKYLKDKRRKEIVKGMGDVKEYLDEIVKDRGIMADAKGRLAGAVGGFVF